MNLSLEMFCASVTAEEDQRGMGGAAKERKRGAGAEGTGEERERGDPCTGRIKMQMSTYILYCSYTLNQHQISKHLPETNQPLKASSLSVMVYMHATCHKSMLHVYSV